MATVPVALYLLAGLAAAVFKLQPRHILPVAFGPLAAAAVVFIIFIIMSATGLTTDYAGFLWRRGKFLRVLLLGVKISHPSYGVLFEGRNSYIGPHRS